MELFDDRIGMIAEGCESRHDGEFIGHIWCLSFFIAEIEKEGGDKENMNEIDPGIPRFLAQSYKVFIRMKEEYEKTQSQNGRECPVRHLITEEGNHEEEGGDNKNMKKRNQNMNIYHSIVAQEEFQKTLRLLPPTPVSN